MRTLYAVVDSDFNELYEVHSTRANAEESILAEAQLFAEETLQTADPMDVFGVPFWIYHEDYHYFLREAGKSFEIIEVPYWED